VDYVFIVSFEDGVPIPEFTAEGKTEWMDIKNPIRELGIIGVEETKFLPMGAISYTQYKEGVMLLLTNESMPKVAQAIVGKYKDGDGYKYITIRYNFKTNSFETSESDSTDVAEWAWKVGYNGN